MLFVVVASCHKLGFVCDGHGHEVLIVDLDDPIHVGVSCLEGIRQRSQHDAALNEVVKLQASFCHSIESSDYQLAKLLRHTEPHVIVSSEQLPGVNVA